MKNKINVQIQLMNQANTLRKRFGEDESSPIDLFHLIQEIDGLTIIYYPLGEHISGICYKGKHSNAIIINSTMSIGRQKFSIAHELYHLYDESSDSSTMSFMEIGSNQPSEKNADRFASYLLIPENSLYCFINKLYKEKGKRKLNLEDVIRLEQYYGVSHKAMLHRLFEDGYITEKDKKSFEQDVIPTALRLGYDYSLYKRFEDDPRRVVLGHYITSIEKLLNQDLISKGKYEELLKDGFREDMVYGLNQDLFVD